ncbi:unnamed protein product [Schistosoma curassoni]|uniref:GATA zinc finger domain-containing protein 14-like n=1 Tax=Schistosoma curassoni TaxID=6186 RepID=A0A183JJG4_9TREM|nr:unnamed protein product [Schistosoma curassoni]
MYTTMNIEAEVALELEKQPVNFIQQQQQPLVSSNRFTEIQPQDLQGNSVNQFNMVFKESLPNSFISTEIVNSDHVVSRHNNAIHSTSNIDFTGNNVESSRPNPISYVTMNSVANHSIHHHVENNITSLNNNNNINCIKQEKTIFIGQNRLSKDKHSVLPSPSSSGGGVGGSDHFGRITDNLAAVSLDNDNDDNDNIDDDDDDDDGDNQNKHPASSNNHAVQRESNSEINPGKCLLF